MIGIYDDAFIDYLKRNLGDVKITTKNIVVPCIYCEFPKKKDHYHLHIGLHEPILHLGAPSSQSVRGRSSQPWNGMQ